jgi:hypothetical protein
VPEKMKTLERELAKANAEIQQLKLQLSNVMLLLKKEMTASGSYPKPMRPKNGHGSK